MRQITTLVAGILLGSAAFTACNKASYDAVPDSHTSAGTFAKLVDNNTVMFTTGSLNASHLSVRSQGAPLVQFNELRNFSLFDLLSNAGLPIRVGKYADLETTIDIRSADGQPALLLDGTIVPVDDAGNTGEAIPVSFAINTPVRLVSHSGVSILTENSNLLNLLNVDVDRLTGGISWDMWQRAIDPGTGRIVISDQSNPELYLMVTKNLGEMLRMLPIGGPNPPASVADAAKSAPADRQNGLY